MTLDECRLKEMRGAPCIWKDDPGRRNRKGEDQRQGRVMDLGGRSRVSQALSEGRQEWGGDSVTMKELSSSSQDFGFRCGRGGSHGGCSAEERRAVTWVSSPSSE